MDLIRDYSLKCSESASKRLGSILGALRAPVADLTSPLIPSQYDGDRDMGREEVAVQFYDWCGLGKLPSWLRWLEDEQASKIGTYSKRSGYHSQFGDGSLGSQVRRYFHEGQAVNLDHGAARHARKALLAAVSAGHHLLHAIPLEVACELFEGRTGFGAPVFSSHPRFHDEVAGLSATVARAIADGKTDGITFDYPGVLGVRGQPKGSRQPSKVRSIFQCSRVIGNLEKQIQVPVMEAIRHKCEFAAWANQRAVDYAMTHLLRKDYWLLSLDFTGFDASVPFEAIDCAFDTLVAMFHREYEPHIRFLQSHFKMQGILTPEGRFEGRQRGVPSGSVLTNLIDTFVNIWAMHYACYRVGNIPVRKMVQGDDGVYAFHDMPDLSAISGVLKEDLGMVASVEKNFLAKNETRFLQNVHRTSSVDSYGVCGGIRPLMRVLNGMLSYERFRSGWNGRMDTLRWIQQLENAWLHPCFTSACEFLFNFDRHSKMFLTETIEELIENAGGMQAVEIALGGPVGFSKVRARKIWRTRAARTLMDLRLREYGRVNSEKGQFIPTLDKAVVVPSLTLE